MTSEQAPPNSRIHSTARTKRRQNMKRTSFGKEPAPATINHVSSVKILKETGSSHPVRKTAKFDPNAENIKPKSNLSITHRDSSSEVEIYYKKSLRASSGSSVDSDTYNKELETGKLSVSTSEDGSAIESGRQKIKILASLLPDEVLKDPVSTSSRIYQTAVMFPDVSGFTQLCQKYDKTGKGGPSRLTAVLNGYIGSMIKIVLSRNGDVLKFGGDAFLCTWKVTEDLDLSEMVHLAIESAIDIQKHCGEHSTDVGVKLRVKVAVAAGTARFCVIGTKTRKHYVIVGPPVRAVREAEGLCKAGDVIVSPSAWKFVKNYMFFSFSYHSDNRHIKVHDFGPLWTRRSLSGGKIRSGLPPGSRPVLKGSSHFVVQDLRPFILTPVMRNIDLGRPLEYLTEMRQIAIVFFNIIADFDHMSDKRLIALSDRVFRSVSEIVGKAGGGTNKLTLFDKDMAILTVFGLKGFKHALASQVALKCAFGCLEELQKLDVSSVSAGVTTGMAYCGVIGHAMRKEYTVMGHPVNMAARLMCAYQNIVCCDRSTFLNSKLESGHFEVLQMEYLKGIQNAGPFYKFNIRPKRAKIKVGQDVQPLLGRAKEVEQFEEFLKNATSNHNAVHFFIIYGSARIGKSRLMQKLLSVAQSRSSERTAVLFGKANEIHAISLAEEDAKILYSTTRLIFQPLLGLGDLSTVEEREDKILSKLKNIKELPFLASYNQIFNVNFELTPQYLALNHDEQTATQMSYLQNLYNQCIQTDEKWLIAIENAEFIDEESWVFLSWCSKESHRALYLLAVGDKRTLSHSSANALDGMKAKRIILTEIDKWYYLGLACQILEVEAIPVELENLLQNYKNSGNPGWLESFLLSLIQSKCIYITSIYSRKMKSMGLVAPPEFMLTSRTMSPREREDSQWVDCLETFETSKSIIRNKIRVCLLGPDFPKINENKEDLTMDVVFIRTIDTLEPLEQWVLKAGSVLGNQLMRDALEFIIAKEIVSEKRQIAKAIKHLFEIKILMCAKGDLNQKNQLLPKRTILETSTRKLICECEGLNIPESCADLPKFANCGCMQFCSSTFRETLYNLLLDHQKKTFHNACIDYIRENTYRCKSCNSVRFQNVFGIEMNNQVVLVCAKTSMHGVRSTKTDPKSNEPINFQFKTVRRSVKKNLDRRSENEYFIGISVVGDCQCPDILSAVYSALLEHAAGSGRKDLMLEIQLEYASLSLTMCNIPLTMQILEKALVHVNQMKEDKEYPEFCSPFIYSKIYTLMGATKLYMGRLDDSLDYFQKALHSMKMSFPNSKFLTLLRTAKQVYSLNLKTEIWPRRSIGKISEKNAPYTELLSECLGLISVVYMYKNNWLKAKYASLKSLNKALQSNRNFYALCTAYANTIEVSYCCRNLETCSKLEVFAIDLCKKCTACSIELFEWEAIGRLYKVIFQTRYARAEIEAAIQIGFQSIKIASVISSTNLKLSLIPDLIFALIQTNRLSEAVTLLQELEFISRLDSDKTSRLWYYSIGLDFQLYTGFTVVSYTACEEFVKTADSVLVRDPRAKSKLYTSMWLWCVRNAEWELIKAHGKYLNTDNSTIYQMETPMNVFMRLERLEGLLIILVYKMDARNIQSINPIYSEIHQFLHSLEDDIKFFKLMKPRYLLLKSYYRQIRFRESGAFTLLNQAQTLAEKMKDINTFRWIGHLKMLWSNAISHIQREYWKEHCRNNVIEWHDSDNNSKKPIISYSLPLPRF